MSRPIKKYNNDKQILKKHVSAIHAVADLSALQRLRAQNVFDPDALLGKKTCIIQVISTMVTEYHLRKITL